MHHENTDYSCHSQFTFGLKTNQAHHKPTLWHPIPLTVSIGATMQTNRVAMSCGTSPLTTPSSDDPSHWGTDVDTPNFPIALHGVDFVAVKENLGMLHFAGEDAGWQLDCGRTGMILHSQRPR